MLRRADECHNCSYFTLNFQLLTKAVGYAIELSAKGCGLCALMKKVPHLTPAFELKEFERHPGLICFADGRCASANVDRVERGAIKITSHVTPEFVAVSALCTAGRLRFGWHRKKSSRAAMVKANEAKKPGKV